MDAATLLEKLGPTGVWLGLVVLCAKWALPRMDKWVKERERVVQEMQDKYLESLKEERERTDLARDELKAVYRSQAEEYRETSRAWIEATTGTTKTQE